MLFFNYSVESKGYRLYHPQSKCIFVRHDVFFVEDAISPVLACAKESDMTLQNVYDTLLPLFNGGSVSTEA